MFTESEVADPTSTCGNMSVKKMMGPKDINDYLMYKSKPNINQEITLQNEISNEALIEKHMATSQV